MQNVGFRNSHETHVNYPMLDRIVIALNKDTKNIRYIKQKMTLNQRMLYTS